MWVDHLRTGNERLTARLHAGEVWSHPFVLGELACGTLKRREQVLAWLSALPQAPLADHVEVMRFLDAHRLMRRGLGWIDVHLLASAALASLPLWTLDRRLATAARGLGISAEVR